MRDGAKGATVAGSVRTFEWVAVIYFVYLLALAWTRRLPATRRWQVTSLAVLVLFILAGVVRWTPATVPGLRDWLPLLYVLIGYRASGLFFNAPMLGFEARLASIDQRLFSTLRLAHWQARTPRAFLEYLEAAYFATPAFLPAGLAMLLMAGRGDVVDRYWTTVMVAEFGAFAVLPWVQTRSPRELEPDGMMDRRAVMWHIINQRLTLPLMIGVNTFPSGHASGSLAVALVVIAVAPAAGSLLLLLALSVAVAAVAGRYHYAADVVLGIVLAVCATVVGVVVSR